MILLEQPDPLRKLPRLGRIRIGLTGSIAFLYNGLTEPVLQPCFASSEDRRNLRYGDDALRALSDRNDTYMEIARMGTGPNDILPVNASQH